MSQNATINPAQAVEILTQVAGHVSLKLSLGEHSAVQESLQVLKKLVDSLTPKAEKEDLTVPPKLSTVK